LRIESIIWRTTASGAAGFSFEAVAEGGRRNAIKQSAINQVPTTTNIATRIGVEADGDAIRNRGLLTSVIEVWTGWKSGRVRARLQNTFSTGHPQLVC